MKLLIIGIIAFLILVYVYTYIRYKKRKGQSTYAVDDFHKKYLKENDSAKATSQKDTAYTKYNSTIDYIEKDEFLKS